MGIQVLPLHAALRGSKQEKVHQNGEAFADVQKAIQEEVYDTQGALSAPQGNKNPWDHNEFLATGLNVDAMLEVIYNVAPPQGTPSPCPQGSREGEHVRFL